MKHLKQLVLSIVGMSLAGTVSLSHADGGQVQQSRPLIDPDTGDVIGIVVPVNACENYEVVKDQSGKVIYVICTGDD
jgi:hypothetical protein